LGTMYHGGPLVPIALAMFIIVIAFSIERFLTIQRARGKAQVEGFSRQIRSALGQGNIDAAIAACDKQGGSVANVVRQGLKKYQEMAGSSEFNKEQKLLNIQKEIEEAIALELPMMEKNLVILSTISSVATLIGLLGTVLGMIKAFAALANSGAPDASALSLGISEALINTALGVATSAIAILAYNYFTTKIDKLTYAIDEAGYSIAQTFAATQK
jgi:biopolymer transport protein ExbB